MESTSETVIISQADKDFQQLLRFKDDPVGLRLACSDISQTTGVSPSYFKRLLFKITEMGSGGIDELFLAMNSSVEQGDVKYTSISRAALSILLFGSKDEEEIRLNLSRVFLDEKYKKLADVTRLDFDNIVYPFSSDDRYKKRVVFAKHLLKINGSK